MSPTFLNNLIEFLLVMSLSFFFLKLLNYSYPDLMYPLFVYFSHWKTLVMMMMKIWMREVMMRIMKMTRMKMTENLWKRKNQVKTLVRTKSATL